jgi:NADH-quinone oxidoreductase subunit E
MLPEDLLESLRKRVAESDHPRELLIDVLLELQGHCGYIDDKAMEAACDLFDMTPLEIDELATFYDFIYREPVGKHVIHVCDSAVCWMNGYASVLEHLTARLGIRFGETTPDGLFTLLPACCIGYCDRSPAMMVNRRVYGGLTPEKIDRILEKCRNGGKPDDSDEMER